MRTGNVIVGSRLFIHLKSLELTISHASLTNSRRKFARCISVATFTPTIQD
jgi:hypothetical protein